MTDSGSQSGKTKISILYVDDEQDLLFLGKRFLERSGEFTVDTMASAQEALNSPRIHSYNAIVSDYQMPGMDGIAFLKVVREKYGDIPFILFTGRGREDIVIEAINNGGDFYLQKGGEPKAQFAELSHKIRQAVRRNLAEHSLQESEKRLSDIIEFLPDATFAIDQSGRIIAWNRAIEEMTGFSSGNMMGKGNFEYAIPFYGFRRPLLIDQLKEPDEKIEALYSDLRRDGHSIMAETDLSHPKGTKISILIKVSSLYNQEGEIVGAIESIRDITELRKTERSLSRSQEVFRRIIETAQEGFWEIDRLQRTVYVNAQLCSLLGYSAEEMIGREFTEFMVPEDIPDHQEKMEERWKGASRSYERRLVHKDGKILWTIFSAVPIREGESIVGSFGTVTDITKRKQSEEELIRSEHEFRALFENTEAATIIIEEDTIVSRANEAFARLIGIPREDIEGKTSWSQFICPDDLPIMLERHRKRREESSTIPQVYEFRLRDSGNRVHSMLIHVGMIPGTRKSVASLIDVTPLKDTERELRRKSEELMASYQELAATGGELRSQYEIHAKKEAALRESEERFRSMAERSSDLVIILNHEMGSTYVSPSARPILGYDPEELAGKPSDFAAATIFSQSGPDIMKAVQKTIQGETVENSEIRISKKDGTPVFVNLYVVPIMEDGRVTGAQVSMRDITATRKAEDALRENQEKFRRFAENARDMLFRILLPEGRYEYISPASMGLTGYAPEEFYSDPHLLQVLIHPAWKEYFREQWKALLEKKVPPTYEFQIIDRSGKIHWINQRNVLVTDEHGEPAALEGIVTDITEQKNTERDLRRNELRFLVATMNTGSLVWEVDREGVITYLSPAVEEILGYLPDELEGNVHFFDLFDPLVREHLKTSAMKIFALINSFSNFVVPCHHKNGSTVIAKTSGTPVFDEKGIFSGYCGIVQDITKEKKAEEKLVESESKYRLLAENVQDVIWTTDENMRFTYVSPSVQELTGYTPKECIERPFRDFLTPESFQLVTESSKQWADILQAGGQISEKTVMELEFVRKDGARVWTEIMITMVFTSDNRFSGIVGVTRDISQRKQAEEKLRKSNCQLSLLSGITRHDILNKITVMKGFLALTATDTVDPTLSEYIQMMKSATNDIQSQIEFTRIYEELGSHEPQWVKLDTVMPRSSLPDSVTLNADVQDILLFGDPMLEKVFFNLLDNSVSHGQQVTDIRVSSHESGNNLIVTWEDNGIGIVEEDKKRIFDRGFGKHTGIGMFLVREILSLTGISIQETGIPGTGARFEIVVPKEAFRRMSRDNTGAEE